MSASQVFEVGDYALLASFMHVKIGKEFDVAKRLSGRFPSGSKWACYLTSYG